MHKRKWKKCSPTQAVNKARHPQLSVLFTDFPSQIFSTLNLLIVNRLMTHKLPVAHSILLFLIIIISQPQPVHVHLICSRTRLVCDCCKVQTGMGKGIWSFIHIFCLFCTTQEIWRQLKAPCFSITLTHCHCPPPSSTAQQEIASLEEKVAGLQRDLSSYETQLDHLRREGSSKAEAGRASEGALHSKIIQLKEEIHSNR